MNLSDAMSRIPKPQHLTIVVSLIYASAAPIKCHTSRLDARDDQFSALPLPDQRDTP